MLFEMKCYYDQKPTQPKSNKTFKNRHFLNLKMFHMFYLILITIAFFFFSPLGTPVQKTFFRNRQNACSLKMYFSKYRIFIYKVYITLYPSIFYFKNFKKRVEALVWLLSSVTEILKLAALRRNCNNIAISFIVEQRQLV